jgi:lipopolysaccharide transport system ATP-binding protein
VEPSSGRAEIRGRITSLLEVGTGFHPELTGRENIYLNGVILGMTRTEIDSKFSEIVAFADTEDFLDTPVKRYSSGMYVRLAFAIAASLESEILIIDEVLAVGDSDFQRKCLRKVNDLAKSGRTVLFVSHNLGTVAHLCTKAILLSQGQVLTSGDVHSVISRYVSHSGPQGMSTMLAHEGRPPGLKARIRDVRVLVPGTEYEQQILCGQACKIAIDFVEPPTEQAQVLIGLYDNHATPIAHLNTSLAHSFVDQNIHRCQINCTIDEVNLVPGTYWINVAYCEAGDLIDRIDRAKEFVVADSDYLGRGKLPNSSHAKVVLRHRWHLGSA